MAAKINVENAINSKQFFLLELVKAQLEEALPMIEHTLHERTSEEVSDGDSESS